MDRPRDRAAWWEAQGFEVEESRFGRGLEKFGRRAVISIGVKSGARCLDAPACV